METLSYCIAFIVISVVLVLGLITLPYEVDFEDGDEIDWDC